MRETMTIQSEALPVVKSSLEMKRKALEFNLRQYRQRVSAFEQAYKMSGGEFAAKFRAGELGDNAEWFEWEFALDALNETEHQLKLLASIKL